MPVVGLGTQDSLRLAKDFRSRHDIKTLSLYWDSGFRSWTHFGIRSQPAAILFGKDGKVLGKWNGMLDIREVDKLV